MTSRERRWIPLVLALLLACADGPDRPVREAVARFNEALDQADAATLWQMADDDTRRFFDDLAKDIAAGAALVDAHWPDDQKAATRKAIGMDYLRKGTDGAALFAAVLDPSRLKVTVDPEARRIERVDLAGASATVVLKSGETLEFRSDTTGAWRTAIFLAPFRDLPGVASLRDNLAVVKANADILSAGREPPAAPPGGPP